jgi:hypothetical protein
VAHRPLATGLRLPVIDPKNLFLKTELNVGLSFARIALQSLELGWKEKSNRNRVAARRAYDALLRFRSRGNLSASQVAEFDQGFASLRERLNRLGEAL